MTFRFILVPLLMIGFGIKSYADVNGTWKPPIGVPIEFTVDRDGIGVSFSRQYVTPLGVFSMGYSEHAVDFQDEYTYVIFKYTDTNQEKIYKINSQSKFRMSNKGGRTDVEVIGNQIKILVTKGSRFNISIETEEESSSFSSSATPTLDKNLNILVFNASDNNAIHRNFAKMLKNNFNISNISTELNWGQKYIMSNTLIFYQGQENKKNALALEKWLSGTQEIRDYDNNPGAFYGFDKQRDLIIFVGEDYKKMNL